MCLNSESRVVKDRPGEGVRACAARQREGGNAHVRRINKRRVGGHAARRQVHCINRGRVYERPRHGERGRGVGRSGDEAQAVRVRPAAAQLESGAAQQERRVRGAPRHQAAEIRRRGEAQRRVEHPQSRVENAREELRNVVRRGVLRDRDAR